MRDEKLLKLGRIFLAETMGTAILLFIGCFGCVDKFQFLNTSHVTISMATGLAVMVAINSFASISGAHINPVVTVAAIIFKMIDFLDAVVYIIAQLLGAILGHSIVKVLISSDLVSDPDNFCMTLPRLDDEKAFVIEFIITFLLMCVICAVWDPKNAKYQDSASIRVGLSVFILVFISGTFSGGSMNPARSFGPAFYNGNWAHHWIYWAGPFLGSVSATFLYKNILMESKSYKKSKGSIIDAENEEQLRQMV